MRGPLSRFLPRPFWGLQGLLGPQLPPWQRVQRLCGVTAGSSGGDGLPPPGLECGLTPVAPISWPTSMPCATWLRPSGHLEPGGLHLPGPVGLGERGGEGVTACRGLLEAGTRVRTSPAQPVGGTHLKQRQPASQACEPTISRAGAPARESGVRLALMYGTDAHRSGPRALFIPQAWSGPCNPAGPWDSASAGRT